MPSAVVGGGPALDESRVHEPGDQVRDGRTGDARAAGKLSARDLAAGDRAKRQVLRNRQRRLVRRQKALDPARRERRDCRERLRGLEVRSKWRLVWPLAGLVLRLGRAPLQPSGGRPSAPAPGRQTVSSVARHGTPFKERRMSTSSSRRPSSIAARNARPGHQQRNGRAAAPGEPSAAEYNGRRLRVLFVGGTTYGLPLSASLARKWDSLAERMDVRVVGRAGDIRAQDPRFRLVRQPVQAAGAFQIILPFVILAEGRQFKPDVVIAQSPYEGLAVLAVRRALRPSPRLVVEVHGDWRTAPRGYGSRARRIGARLADRGALLALRGADGTRSLSPFTAAITERATGNKPLASFPAYFDHASFVAEPARPLPAEPTVAWVAMLQHHKAPYVFAEAWRRTARRMPEARLTMVGDGPLRPVAETLVRDLPGRVRLERRLPPREVSRILDESTLLVLPSWSEGMPRVVMEAFTRGRPVVGSAVGGIPDMVTHGRNGLLVPPGNAEHLADALVSVLSDRPLAEQLARAALDDAAFFHRSAAEYADAVQELVEKVIRGR
jgi:glycosyltransferase involved in cell wall biosynthesis